MTTEQFIFTKQFPQRTYRHILFWVLFYVFSLLTYFHDGLDKVGFKNWAILEISEDFFHVFTQMLFCYAVLYFLYPVIVVKKRYFLFAFSFIALGVATFWLYYFEHIYFFKAIHAKAGMPFRPPDIVYWFAMISLFTYFPVSTGLAITIKVLKNFYLKQKQNEVLSKENASAELRLLKAQVHPHFLFNTLNNIYSFTLDKSMQAPKLVKNLADTLQYMINDCEENMVPLNKEIKMMNDYIELERVRYGQRLEMQVAIEGNTNGKYITPLLMIPFIENSFKHGASKMMTGGWIHLFIQADNDLLHFTLANGKSPDTKTNSIGGIGLSNVVKRLELLYPGTHLLKTDITENTYTVSMQVPLFTNIPLPEKNKVYAEQ